MKNKLTIIKVGGGVLNDKKYYLKSFYLIFRKLMEKKYLVHGGGIIASNYYD